MLQEAARRRRGPSPLRAPQHVDLAAASPLPVGARTFSSRWARSQAETRRPPASTRWRPSTAASGSSSTTLTLLSRRWSVALWRSRSRCLLVGCVVLVGVCRTYALRIEEHHEGQRSGGPRRPPGATTTSSRRRQRRGRGVRVIAQAGLAARGPSCRHPLGPARSRRRLSLDPSVDADGRVERLQFGARLCGRARRSATCSACATSCQLERSARATSRR